MEAYKKAHIAKAVEIVAAKLNAENAENDLFSAIADMECNSVVNADSLNIWAETSIEHLLDAVDELDGEEMQAYNFSFVELLFISEHSEEIVNLLEQ